MSVTCHTCGQEWERDPVLEVECPVCHAKVGQVCRRPSGHNVFGNSFHPAREDAAMAAGFLQMCPKGPTAMGLKPGKKKPEPSLFA
jgi:hypothetical protein